MIPVSAGGVTTARTPVTPRTVAARLSSRAAGRGVVTGSGLSTVTAPSSSNRAPPGHYMVFILNGNDVPSVAKIVQIR